MRIKITNLTPEELQLTGAIPLTQKAAPNGVATLGSDRKVFADQLPLMPTLAELGGEPAGAEIRSRAYTDLKISELPPPVTPTLSELGGEPAGAEIRSRAYTDLQLAPFSPLIAELQARIFALEDRVKANEFKLSTWVPYALRINCGTNSVSYLDSQGGSWLRDTYFTGGTAYDVQTQAGAPAATGTSDPTIYRYERSLDSGTFTYTIPVASGTYTIQLHFCENYHNAANLRVGTIRINGTIVLSNFDVWAQAGGRYKALIRNFTRILSTGSVVISVQNTLINGIELIKTA